MITKLQKKFDILNVILDKNLKFMDSLSEDARFKSGAEEWNAAQILNHLFVSEQGVVAYLEKKVLADKDEVPKGGLSAKLRAFLLQRALRNDKTKFRAPKFFEALPERPDYQKIKAEYPALRSKLGAVLERFDASMVGKAYFKHPRAGRITILQTLDFLTDHFQRHERQMIERSEG